MTDSERSFFAAFSFFDNQILVYRGPAQYVVFQMKKPEQS